jgi:hypothetical protein
MASARRDDTVSDNSGSVLNASTTVSNALIKLVNTARASAEPAELQNASGLAGELEFSDFFSVRRPKHLFAGACGRGGARRAGADQGSAGSKTTNAALR